MTKKEIRQNVVTKGQDNNYGRMWGYAYERGSVRITKPTDSGVVTIEVESEPDQLAFAGTKEAFVDVVYSFYRNRSIAGGLLSGGVRYNSHQKAILNHRGEAILLVADIKDSLNLTPKAAFAINKYADRYKDDLGEFLAKVINAELE